MDRYGHDNLASISEATKATAAATTTTATTTTNNNTNLRVTRGVKKSSEEFNSAKDTRYKSDDCGLTQAGLEEYSRSYFEQNPLYNHQKQSSYAQSEGYHSYVSSLDSSSTPFLDRLRQESETLHSRNLSWSQDYHSCAGSNLGDNSPDSSSSTETLKWLGSMSDVSVNSHTTNNSEAGSPSQLIVHSSKVRTPQRHNSESVLFMKGEVQPDAQVERRSNNRLFPISTYTEPSPQKNGNSVSQTDLSKNSQNWQSVAERINEIEKATTNTAPSITTPTHTFLEPTKTSRMPNPALKALQKNAVQSYFERQQQSVRESVNRGKSNTPVTYQNRPQSLNLTQPTKNVQRASVSGYVIAPTSANRSPNSPMRGSEPNLGDPTYDPRNVVKRIASTMFEDKDVPPTPPPRNRPAVRRTSSAAEYSSIRDKLLTSKQHLSKDLLGPIILGSVISIDDWVPERPPKNPTLRIPSPDLPPPPALDADKVLNKQDEPLPPPPEEVLQQPALNNNNNNINRNAANLRRNSFAGPPTMYRTAVVDNLAHHHPHHLHHPPPPPPPAVPKKPEMHHRRSAGPLQAHRVIVTECAVVEPASPPQPKVPLKSTEVRMSVRKRPHNSVGIPLIVAADKGPPPAPPLKPRMSNNFRSGSKATYLPRQIHEKHQITGPDHGSYKLKLNSNEDCINTEPPYGQELLPQLNNNNKSNLPDVLPLAVKYNQRASYGGPGGVYESKVVSQNISVSKQKAVPQSAPIISTNNLRSLFNFSKAQVSFNNEETKEQQATTAFSPKYTQSSIDLHKTLLVDTQPFTREALINFTTVTARDDQPPYPKIEHEVVQHLELPVIEAIMPERDDTETEPPPYEETQSVVEEDDEEEESLDEEEDEIEVKEEKIEETLKLMQRTEIVLRLNAPTSEAASQTEDLEVQTPAQSPTEPKTPPQRKVSPEEIDCDSLSKDLVSQLSPSDKLHQILVPPKSYRSTSDYISELYNIQVISRPIKRETPTQLIEESLESTDTSSTSSTQTESASSSLYSRIDAISKANFKHYNREMTLINGDACDLTKKKEELVERLGKKLEVLTNEQATLVEESTANEMLGDEVAQKVAEKLKPSEASRYRSYVNDVGYITKLLLSLSGRLAKTHNVLQNIEEKSPEKKPLEMKRDRLISQLEEAKHLKEDIDRRGTAISKLLEKSLSIEEFADFDYFINMKAKLLVDSTEISNKIKMGEEQLSALKETLVHSEC